MNINILKFATVLKSSICRRLFPRQTFQNSDTAHNVLIFRMSSIKTDTNTLSSASCPNFQYVYNTRTRPRLAMFCMPSSNIDIVNRPFVTPSYH